MLSSEELSNMSEPAIRQMIKKLQRELADRDLARRAANCKKPSTVFTLENFLKHRKKGE